MWGKFNKFLKYNLIELNVNPLTQIETRKGGEFSLAEDSFGEVKHLAVSLENIVNILFG